LYGLTAREEGDHGGDPEPDEEPDVPSVDPRGDRSAAAEADVESEGDLGGEAPADRELLKRAELKDYGERVAQPDLIAASKVEERPDRPCAPDPEPLDAKPSAGVERGRADPSLGEEDPPALVQVRER